MATTTATKNKRKPAHGARLTGEQNAEKGFTATKELGDNLQKVLVDLIEQRWRSAIAESLVVSRPKAVND